MKTISYILKIALASVLLTVMNTGVTQANDDRNLNINRNCVAGSNQSTLNVVGLTNDQRLICFNERNPGQARTLGVIQGLVGDTGLVGIDFRVQNNALYGVGNAGGVYIITVRNGIAQKVSQLTEVLDGVNFGVDFNPAADRLRVISDSGQNLRHNLNDNTTAVDDTLTYPPSTVPALGITGAAYTNNDFDINTATTLFDLDTALNQVVIQSPANSGTLAVTGKFPIITTPLVGFDIYTTRKRRAENEGFASLVLSDGRARFFSVNLLTGKFRNLGSFRGQNQQVVDIAVPLRQR
jgi:hypothetical protein